MRRNFKENLRQILKVASKLGEPKLENEIGKVKLDESMKGEVKLCEILGKSLPIYLEYCC